MKMGLSGRRKFYKPKIVETHGVGSAWMVHIVERKWHCHAWTEYKKGKWETETERRRREQEIINTEIELADRQRELEEKELELEEKEALLEIAIRVNELSIETRYGGLERRLEELQIAYKLRRNQNMEIKRGSIDNINTCWDDETSSESEKSN